jgi:hypothetical protein
MLAEKITKALNLLGQGRQIRVRGCPLLLTGGPLAEQLPFPVAQPCSGLEVLCVYGRFFVPADLRDFLIEVADVRPGADATLEGRQARLHRVDAVEDLRQQLAPPAASLAGARCCAYGQWNIALITMKYLDDLLADPVQIAA